MAGHGDTALARGRIKLRASLRWWGRKWRQWRGTPRRKPCKASAGPWWSSPGSITWAICVSCPEGSSSPRPTTPNHIVHSQSERTAATAGLWGLFRGLTSRCPRIRVRGAQAGWAGEGQRGLPRKKRARAVLRADRGGLAGSFAVACWGWAGGSQRPPAPLNRRPAARQVGASGTERHPEGSDHRPVRESRQRQRQRDTPAGSRSTADHGLLAASRGPTARPAARPYPTPPVKGPRLAGRPARRQPMVWLRRQHVGCPGPFGYFQISGRLVVWTIS